MIQSSLRASSSADREDGVQGDAGDDRARAPRVELRGDLGEEPRVQPLGDVDPACDVDHPGDPGAQQRAEHLLGDLGEHPAGQQPRGQGHPLQHGDVGVEQRVGDLLAERLQVVGVDAGQVREPRGLDAEDAGQLEDLGLGA